MHPVETGCEFSKPGYHRTGSAFNRRAARNASESRLERWQQELREDRRRSKRSDKSCSNQGCKNCNTAGEVRDVSHSSSCLLLEASRAALRAAARRFEVGELRKSRTRYDHCSFELSVVPRSSSFLVPRSSSSVVLVPRLSFLVFRRSWDHFGHIPQARAERREKRE